MQVLYVGGFDAVDIQVGTSWVTVKKGESVDVPADIAGKAPSAAHIKARAELAAVQARRDAGEPGLDQALIDAIGAYHSADPGHGLLAQDENWAHPAKKDDGKDGTK